MYGQGQGQMPGQQYGQAPNNRDPLGRSMYNQGGADLWGERMPTELDLGKARAILEELQRRASERQRPADRARLPAAPAAPLLSCGRRPRLAGRQPSPNVDERPPGCAVDTLILHYTGMPSAARGARAAVRSGGQGQRPLPDRRGRQRRGAGRRGARAPGTPGSAPGRAATRLNDCSIGIELVNPGHEWGYRPFPEAQYAACIELCRAIVARWPIPPRAGARPQRRRAGPQAGPGRAVRLAAPRRRRHRAVAGARRRPAAQHRAAPGRARPLRLRRRRATAGSTPPRAAWSPPSSATSGPSGSTARPIAGTLARLDGLLALVEDA